MERDKPINYEDLPGYSLWDGSPIQRRRECDGCRFLVDAERDGVDIELCAWGVAWKELVPVVKPGKCSKVNKPPPPYSSLGYIKRRIEWKNREQQQKTQQ